MPAKTINQETIETPVVIGETKEDSFAFASDRKDSKRYFEGIGRRKRSVARVRIFTANPKDSAAEGNFTVNNKTLKDYFREVHLTETALESLNRLKASDHFKVSVKVNGGGIRAQAEAIRLGAARALIKFDQNFRKKLKKSGLLSRDPREKERRKYGLKKARRAPQFSKR
ncbi:MAG: 30S ribosomal protein S9 [Parcubacteria group bacterium]|nr:30S ribosomal protein S9 [Parcubacteria group bacterium]